jgi:hypothetical protein
MSIKSDRWIRRMAQAHGMIEPFEPGQVRVVDGQRIVSYGTSSYGYDVRVGSAGHEGGGRASGAIGAAGGAKGPSGLIAAARLGLGLPGVDRRLHRISRGPGDGRSRPSHVRG